MKTYGIDKDFLKFFLSQSELKEKQVCNSFLKQVYNFEQEDLLDYIEFFSAIKSNEGIIKSHGNKLAEEFTGILRGFHKVHHYHPNNLLKNTGSYLGHHNGKHNKNSDRIFYTAMKDKNLNKNEIANKLTDGLCIEAINNRIRNNNLTGEWIIFKKYKNENYYLLLAFHRQTNEEILEKLKTIIKNEFPFLQEDI